MSAEAQILLVVGAYLALNLFVGWRAARSASDSATGFVAGDRSMGPVLMYFVTGATIFSAFAFLGAPGRAFSTGAAAFHILAFGVLGFLPFYWTGPAAARLGRLSSMSCSTSTSRGAACSSRWRSARSTAK